MNTSTITVKTASRLSSSYDIAVKMHKGTITRATGCALATMHLLETEGCATVKQIDDLCYVSFGFPVSHRKYSPLKTKGGLSETKRVQRYLIGDNRFNPHSDTVASYVSLDDMGNVYPTHEFDTVNESNKTALDRRVHYHTQQDKNNTRPKDSRVAILIKSDLKKISKMLAVHIAS